MSTLLEELRAGLASRYDVLQELGAGGMGLVFEARDTVLDRRVAIKVLRPERASGVNLERFLREGRTLARLSHPHIVTVHDAGETNGLSYLVMDLVDGPSLASALAAGPWPVARVRTLAMQLLAALESAHEAGIVHRDIKPSNIFLLGDRAVLGDFGISSELEGDQEPLTEDGQRPGTVAYMAPERLAGRPADARSDQYAMALVLVEALTGRRLAPGEADDERSWRGVPEPLAGTLRRALAVPPAARWPSARAFSEALRDRGRPRRHWLPPAAAIVALIGGTLALRALGMRDAGVVDEPVAPADLAVLAFGDDDGDGLGRRLARLVGSALEPFPQLRVVPVPLALDGDVPSARLVARGEVRRSAAALELGVEVRDANQSLVHAFVVRGDSADPEVLARAVADSLVRRIRPLELQAFRSLAFHRVGDARAITAFLAGDSAFQRDDWVAAEAAFREAVSRDPGFLQAMWGLMIARRFQREEFADELQHLRRHVDSLPPFQRALLAAQEEPDVRLRVERYAALVRSSGGNGQAWLHYTNELFHRGALLGRALDVTLDSMAQLAASHPAMRHASTYDLLIWGNVRLARRREAEREAARRARVAVAGGGFGALHDLALALRFGTVRGWLARRMVLERASPGLLDTLALVGRLGLSLGLPRDQLLIGRLLARRGDTDSTRATGHAAMALAAAAMGRPAEALRQLDSAALASGAPEFTLQRLEWPVLLRVLGLPVDPTRVTSARAGLEALARQQGASAARARFALALDALAVGDSSGAGAHAMALAGDTALVALRLQALLRAHLAGAFGQPELALALSDVVMRLDSATYRSGPLARPATYLARGRWYLQLARPADADAAWRWHENSDLIGWPSAAPQLAEVDAMLAGVAELRRAALAQARGEHRLACARLALPRERWRDVEPAWRPLLAERDSLWREAACRS